LNSTEYFSALFTQDKRTNLPADTTFDEAVHLWEEAEYKAVRAALLSNRPLLIYGEPGSGKTQLARAVCMELTRQDTPACELFTQVVHPRFEALDLIYQFDAVRRLADAQGGRRVAQRLEHEKYLSKGVIWRSWECEGPSVVLIDEIDKGPDADLPHTLLDVLANRSFTIPQTRRTIGLTTNKPGLAAPKLVCITSNRERDLPEAFVRRCVVLNRVLPKEKADLVTWLVNRGKAQTQWQISETVLLKAAMQTVADRDEARRFDYRIGLGEYMDLLRALHEACVHAPNTREQEQGKLIDELSAYFLVKHPEQDQQRAPFGQPNEAG
jgi:MoxR-like ATPase